MCGTCGCNQPEDAVTVRIPGEKAEHEHEHHHHDHPHDDSHPHSHSHSHEHRKIVVEQDILAKNNQQAHQNRHFFTERGIFVLNLVSSPGSGKTALLERTLTALKDQLSCSVIEGDQQTENDAERIQKTGVPVVQVNTGSGCHLEADMVERAVAKLAVPHNSLLFIENVGNLVCPAMFDLGESHKVAVISVTEGEDKPQKYPQMFRAADVCIINKIDLLPYLDFDISACISAAKQVNPALKIIQVSVKTGEGMQEWYDWLVEKNRQAFSK